MEIYDNGRSFEVEKTLLARNPKRLGLIGMKERIEIAQGQLVLAPRTIGFRPVFEGV